MGFQTPKGCDRILKESQHATGFDRVCMSSILIALMEKVFAVCPGGEGAVLKTVGLRGLAGSNPVYGAFFEEL